MGFGKGLRKRIFCFEMISRTGLCSAVFAVIFFTSCYMPREVKQSAIRDNVTADAAIKYSFIYVIHGEGSYLYHDSQGNVHHADQEALEQALEVARNSPTGEVFIFHQGARTRRFFFLPGQENVFYYFKNARLIKKESYPRARPAGLEYEAKIYEQYAVGKTDSLREGKRAFFAYFGHSIPEFEPGTGDLSQKVLTSKQLAAGFKKFLDSAGENEGKFEVVVLSSCYSGTPGVLLPLSNYTRYVIASPENLHLSYLDTRSFMEVNMSDTVAGFDAGEAARTLARRSFEKLKKNTQTAIAISIYEIEKIAPYLRSLESRYQPALAWAQAGGDWNKMECDDCLKNPDYISTSAAAGVEVFYHPARFGRKKDQFHSGWSCWQIKPEESRLQTN